MSVLCYTCSKTVESAVALRCARPYCQGKKEAQKEIDVAQKAKWAREREEEQKGWTIVIPDIGDDWTSDL